MTKTFTVDQVEFRSVKAAAEHFGVPYRTVLSRLRSGADIEEALGFSEPETRTCTWCQREWPTSNYDFGKSQCRGCRNLERNHGLSAEEAAAWVLHEDGPRCGLCKEGYSENGGPLPWGGVYRGEETAGYRIPVCAVCAPVLELSRERFGAQVARDAGLAPVDVVRRLVEQNHVCPACERALNAADTVFVPPALIHRKCRLSVQ